MNSQEHVGLEQKRALVTGASSGIGAAIAIMLADAGATVGLHYCENETGAKKVAEAIEAGGGMAATLKADLSLEADRDGLISAVSSSLGGLDILINNAGGVYGYGAVENITADALETTFSLNSVAPFILMRDAFKVMSENGWGRIVNISTVSVKYGGSLNNIHYVASKAALESMTRGFARAGVGSNILVNTVRSGVIDTPMRTKIDGYTEERFRERVAMIPLGRAGSPEEVAAMTLHLVSPAGNFITGEIFTVAGGD